MNKNIIKESVLVNNVEEFGRPTKESTIKYLNSYDKNGNEMIRCATFVAILEENKVYIGYSVRSPKDKTINKKWGWALAEKRARELFDRDILDTTKSTFPYILRELDPNSFIHFVDRCKNRKVYQGKEFPKWIDNIKQ